MRSVTLDRVHLSAPCVYLVLGSQDQPLYIGVGSSGMVRVFIADAQSQRTKALSECSRIEVRFFQTSAEAREEERRLIHTHHPPANRFCGRCTHYSERRGRNKRQNPLFGVTRQAVLGLLLSDPEKTYHERGIHSIIGGSPGTLHRELLLLADSGVITKQERGNRVYYAAAVDHPCFPELQSMMVKGF